MVIGNKLYVSKIGCVNPGHRIRIHKKDTRVGAFEVFEAAHVVLRRPEIDRSNNSQPVKASQFVRDLYYRMVNYLAE